MKRIRHGSGTFLADDKLAELVLTYAAVLANRRKVDVVQIPAIDDAGQALVVSLLVGWQLPLSAVTMADDGKPWPRAAASGGVLQRAAAELRGRISRRTLGGAAYPVDAVPLAAGSMA
jgi:hypothetical protein